MQLLPVRWRCTWLWLHDQTDRQADVKQKLIAITRQVKQEIEIYQIVIKDERTPWLARGVLGAAIGYLILPFDLIPDAIPVLGQLDDLIIVPGLIWMALKLIPEEVVFEAREAVSVQEGAGEENLREEK